MKRILTLIILALTMTSLIGCSTETSETIEDTVINISGDKDADVSVDETGENESVVSVNLTYNMEDETTLLDKSSKILEKIFTENEEVSKVTIAVDTGTESNEVVMIVIMDKSTADSIDWSKFDAAQLPELADAYTFQK